MTKKTHLWVLKYALMVLLLWALYILQTTPRLFSIYGVKPILVVPAAVCMAMFDGEMVGGIMGGLAGLLCDLGSFTIFGFNGIIVLACCATIGLLTIYLTQLRLMNALLLGFGTLLIRGVLEYFFYFQIWNLDGRSQVFLASTLPTVLYSAITIIPLYFLVRYMKYYFDSKLKT